MNSEYKFPQTLRAGIVAALPEETSQHGETPQAGHVYLPSTHAKALHPNNTLIQGMRGSGKSFWFQSLQNRDLRALLGVQVGLDADTRVSVGFSPASGGNEYPSKDTLISLITAGYEPRRIWQAVVFRQVIGDQAPDEFRGITSWKDRIDWVVNHPESADQLWYKADMQLDEQKQFHIVLFDALDRTADDWLTMNKLIKGLLQVVLDTRSFRRIRLKVFARPDQLDDPSVAAFPDASKVMNQKVNLDWPRRELYGLLWQYLANNVEFGEPFREGARMVSPTIQWEQIGNIWRVPEVIRSDEELQKKLFHAISGPWMGKDKRRGFPYSWLPSHLGDASGEVSPRSFLAALRFAAEDKVRNEQEYVLHYESIKRGVQEASAIRVRELQEDYPWISKLFEPLRGISVPCPFEDIRSEWLKNNIVTSLRNGIQDASVRLPPVHIDNGEDGILIDLLALGLVEQLKDKRINLPDVYRVGYGMGRRGGVKPLKG
ncbi:hypothetical protein [Sulfuriferula thiophila]|uniref:hypothetical protein n=1 Tax=Sulfuriferula thiophila TaxID=1781211 RepID=UPI000F60DC00|nr:hypothetical protein [Sulfuriferula thiophila]